MKVSEAMGTAGAEAQKEPGTLGEQKEVHYGWSLSPVERAWQGRRRRDRQRPDGKRLQQHGTEPRDTPNPTGFHWELLRKEII